MPKGRKKGDPKPPAVKEFKNKYRIWPYSHGWVIEGLYVHFDEERKGLEAWYDQGHYYGTLEGALVGFMDYLIKYNLSADEQKPLLQAIREAQAEVTKMGKELNISYLEAHKTLNIGKTE